MKLAGYRIAFYFGVFFGWVITTALFALGDYKRAVDIWWLDLLFLLYLLLLYVAAYSVKTDLQTFYSHLLKQDGKSGEPGESEET